MLFISVARPELLEQAVAQILQTMKNLGFEFAQGFHQSQAQQIGIELRLDLFPSLKFDWIQDFLRTSPFPVLLTLRKSSQGGGFRESEEEREKILKKLFVLQPPFFDLEYDTRPAFLKKAMEEYPNIQWIISYHNFEEDFPDLEKVYKRIESYPAFSYKIAVQVANAIDALKMLLFSKRYPKVSAICMGKEGQFARVLGPIVGNRVHYASLDAKEQTAIGQMSFDELVNVYHFLSLNENTAIYGLIGDPVEKSLGHLYHNAVFGQRKVNAVYVKMRIKVEELASFMQQALQLGIKGLSVTIPLKEKIVPFVQQMQREVGQIGAVNTLLWEKGKLWATNTDGIGALNAIEKQEIVAGKKVAILGAGGAARAIAFEAKKRGAEVWILNRGVKRAKELALELGCKGGGLDEVPKDYDILIHSTPEPMPIDASQIRPKTLAMDVVYFPRETLFLQSAAIKGCRIVYGEEMFFNQAALQTSFWMHS